MGLPVGAWPIRSLANSLRGYFVPWLTLSLILILTFIRIYPFLSICLHLMHCHFLTFVELFYFISAPVFALTFCLPVFTL